MQDKEMDGLFRSKLEGFEMEPSAGVWPGIAAELDPPKKKYPLVPFLNVAASIVVLVGAGLLFLPKKVVVQHKRAVVAIAGKVVTSVNHVSTTNSVAQATASGVVLNHQSNIAVAQPGKAALTGAVSPVTTIAKPAINTQPIQQEIIANVPLKQPEVKAVVPDNSTPLIAKQAPDLVQAFNTQPQVAAVVVMPIQKDTLPIIPRRGIHSIGGLVNVLVAKVDKRRDKIIEFSADDDGESHVTGINLGIIKIKKRE